MIDLSEEPLEENIEICKEYLSRMSKIGMTLEIELGITGGEEDGVDNSGDCYNPKVVQSSMGSISRVSISYMEFDNLISSVSYNTVATDLNGKSLKEHIFSKNQIIFFGNESNGFMEFKGYFLQIEII